MPMPHQSGPRPEVKTVDVEIKTHASFFGRLRAYFFTGLVITAPIAITVWATYWFVTMFDAWVKPLLPQAYNPDNYLPIPVPGFGLIFALLTITVIGFMAAALASCRRRCSLASASSASCCSRLVRRSTRSASTNTSILRSSFT